MAIRAIRGLCGIGVLDYAFNFKERTRVNGRSDRFQHAKCFNVQDKNKRIQPGVTVHVFCILSHDTLCCEIFTKISNYMELTRKRDKRTDRYAYIWVKNLIGGGEAMYW